MQVILWWHMGVTPPSTLIQINMCSLIFRNFLSRCWLIVIIQICCVPHVPTGKRQSFHLVVLLWKGLKSLKRRSFSEESRLLNICPLLGNFLSSASYPPWGGQPLIHVPEHQYGQLQLGSKKMELTHCWQRSLRPEAGMNSSFFHFTPLGILMMAKES